MNLLVKLKSSLEKFVVFFNQPLWSFLVSFGVYLVYATLRGSPLEVSNFAYFNYLADAFLHGQLHLRILPPLLFDLSFFDGKYYLYWPPMPAIILMPLIAVFGVNFSDVLFCLTLGAFNVALISQLLTLAQRDGLIALTEFQRGLLVIFFAFGTVHLTLAPVGGVWFVGQLTGFCFVALAYLAALGLQGRKAFFFTGLAIASAMLTRNHLIFLGIWPGIYLVSKNWGDKRQLALNVLIALLPALVLGGLFLVYNHQRFGGWLDVGIPYHKMADFFAADYKKYGAFNLYYLPTNLYYQYIFYPYPIRAETVLGGSLFLLSPVFLGVFLVDLKGNRNLDILTLAISILLTSLPILLLMGTGWVQFGPRYTLDFTVPLLLLSAMGIKKMSKLALILLVLISLLHYGVGAVYFMRLP